ncbi:MAG TPA: hypothetical protein VFX16_12780 [Pseudonocardiaceae bacterium]|nr:hypothetical protein [Pseudonocardiaceae bacterium]
MWGTRVALERMRPRDRGVIVQTGSAIAYRGIPLQSVYSGAKYWVGGSTMLTLWGSRSRSTLPTCGNGHMTGRA